MIEYIVNEKERKVTAVIRGDRDELIHKAEAIYGDLLSDTIKEKLRLKGEYEATANCDPSDKFDVEIGKKLAKGYVLKKVKEDKHLARIRFIKAIKDIYCRQYLLFSGKVGDTAMVYLKCDTAIPYSSIGGDKWDNGIELLDEE